MGSACCKRMPEENNWTSSDGWMVVNGAENVPVIRNQTLSSDSLMDAISSFLQTNQESIQDFTDNPELFDLVQEYLDNSRYTLDFFNELDLCLNDAMKIGGLAKSATGYFREEQQVEVGSEKGKTNYKKTSDELRRLIDSDSPFTTKFHEMLESVQSRHVRMLRNLESKAKEVDKKLRKVKSWRKLLGVILLSSVAAILICSVVAAAMAVPPVAAAFAAVTSLPLWSAGNWIVNSLWKGYEKELRRQRDLNNTVRLQTFGINPECGNIQVLIEKVKDGIECLVSAAELALRDDEAVSFYSIVEIRNRNKVLTKSIEDLRRTADRCRRCTLEARQVVIGSMIINPASR